MQARRRRYTVVRARYQPFEKQRIAHRAGQRQVLVRGGNGSGKTTWLIGEMINAARMNPGGRILFLSPNYGSQNRAVMPKLVEMFPGARRFPKGPGGNARRDLGPLAKEWSAAERRLTMWSGAQVFFASADHVASFDGIEACAVLIDEPRFLTEESWEVAKYRLRQPGTHHRIAMSGRPNMTWLYDEFGPGRDTATCFDIEISTLDNPHTSQAFKDSFRSLTARRRAVLEGGEWQAQSGIVYGDEYLPSLAGSLVDMEPEPALMTWLTIDPGGSPYAAIIQRTEDGIDVVTAEILINSPRTHTHARAIVEEMDRWGLKADHLVMDVQGSAKDEGTRRTVAGTYLGILSKAGVLRATARQFAMCKTQVERNIPAGVDRVRDRLFGLGGIRLLKVAARLATRAHQHTLPEDRVGVDRSFRGYAYPEGKVTDRPHKDGRTDHACDALRYWCVKTHGVLSEHDVSTQGTPPAKVQPIRRTAESIERPTW